MQVIQQMAQLFADILVEKVQHPNADGEKKHRLQQLEERDQP
jgi:hypothetical protein